MAAADKGEELADQFALLDHDKNGEITAAELLHTVTELGLSLADEEVDEIIRYADIDGDGKIEVEEFPDLMAKLGKFFLGQPKNKSGLARQNMRTVGVSDLWNRIDHIAIVVSDVGRSAAFYGNILGMIPIPRPDFDRFGAWFNMGSINIHLIKGRPAVHLDDDLIVGHIALDVGTEDKVKALMGRLDELGVKYRENISVPNPKGGDGKSVKQAFVRDPDGYYLEFCSCKVLEDYMEEKLKEYEMGWDDKRTQVAENFKETVAAWKLKRQKSVVKMCGEMATVDPEKLAKLVKRQKTYGDITQSATVGQLELLLSLCNNDIPEVIKALMEKAKTAGGRTYKPPAFFDRDDKHTFIEPPRFQMDMTTKKNNEIKKM